MEMSYNIYNETLYFLYLESKQGFIKITVLLIVNRTRSLQIKCPNFIWILPSLACWSGLKNISEVRIKSESKLASHSGIAYFRIRTVLDLN